MDYFATKARNRDDELRKLEGVVKYQKQRIAKQSMTLKEYHQKLIQQNEDIQSILTKYAALDDERRRLMVQLLDAQHNAEEAKKKAIDIEKSSIDSEKQYEENAAHLKEELRRAKEEGVFYRSVVVRENLISTMRAKREQFKGGLVQEERTIRYVHEEVAAKELNGTDCGGHHHLSQDSTFSVSDVNFDFLTSFEALNLSISLF